MTLVRHQALLLLALALTMSAGSSHVSASTTNLNAANSASAVGKASVDGLQKANDKLRRLAQASETSTQELRGGFEKLKRICDYGPRAGATTAPTYDEAPLITLQTRGDLRSVKDALARQLGEFKTSSRITRNGVCQYLPPIFFLSSGCQKFQEDSERLATATQIAGQITKQAEERLGLYDQYWRLEQQSCTRPGFAKKLWNIEEKSLWPKILDTPSDMNVLLQNSNTDE